MNGSGPRPIAALWEWQESAACRTVDSARFFSPPGERGEARRARERLARQVCDVCVVREECARFAYAIGEEYGTWGGTTDQERIAELRRPRGGRSRADIAAGARTRETAAQETGRRGTAVRPTASHQPAAHKPDSHQPAAHQAEAA